MDFGDIVLAVAIMLGKSLLMLVALLIFIAWWVLDLMRMRVLPLPPDPPSVGVSPTPLDGRIDLAVHGDPSR